MKPAISCEQIAQIAQLFAILEYFETCLLPSTLKNDSMCHQSLIQSPRSNLTFRAALKDIFNSVICQFISELVSVQVFTKKVYNAH